MRYPSHPIIGLPVVSQAVGRVLTVAPVLRAVVTSVVRDPQAVTIIVRRGRPARPVTVLLPVPPVPVRYS